MRSLLFPAPVQEGGAEQERALSLPEVVFYLSLLSCGLFHEWQSVLFSLPLCGWLCVRLFRQNSLGFHLHLPGLAVLATVVFYGLSCFWAVDRGMAVFGFFKFFPLLLWALVLMQEPSLSCRILTRLPLAATVMTVLSALLMQIPALTSLFSVAGRLSGFFQYPNTFALFLLVALIRLATDSSYSRKTWWLMPILLFGILYSGSRTVFVLTILSALPILLLQKDKVRRLIFGIGLVLAVALAAVYALYTGTLGDIGRFLTLSWNESTFLGRLLYARDALPVIATHPVGLGYLGYYYLQSSFQTGLYSVRFVHNELLQCLLDIGWIPALLWIGAIGFSLFRRGRSCGHRLTLGVIVVHSLLDFDLQYLSIFFLLLLFLDLSAGRRLELRAKAIVAAGLGLCSLAGIYFALAQGLYQLGHTEVACRLYPAYTEASLFELTEAEDAGEMSDIANTLLQRNPTLSVAYSAKAHAAFSEGDFHTAMIQQEEAIARSPLVYEYYEDYARILLYGTLLYEQAGDTVSTDICRDRLLALSDELAAVEQRLSPLGRRIQDQPRTTLPEEVLEAVKEE